MESQADQKTHQNYLLFWSGQLISLLGSSIAQFVIIWWIALETESAFYLSIAFLVGFAPEVILTPFAGVYVDRWNRKKLIGVVDFLQASATVALILLFTIGIASYWHVLALLALRGVFQAFHSPAVSAIIPLMVPHEKLSRMNGLNFLFIGVVKLIGPVTAAFLLDFWEIQQILWIDGITFLVAVAPLFIINIPSVVKKQSKVSFRKEFMEGLSFLKNGRGFLALLGLLTIITFLLQPLITLLPFFVKFDHFGEATDLAFVMASIQGGAVVGGLLMSLIKGFKKKMNVVLIMLYVLYFGYTLIALTPTGLFWFMALAGFLMVFSTPIINVTIITIFQSLIPLEMQGRINSVIMALASAASPLGMIFSGVLAELIGTANLFLSCSLLGFVIVTLAWFFTDVKHVEK